METTVSEGRGKSDLTGMVPPFMIALLAALLYVALAEFGYQLTPLTVDRGRICLVWLPFSACVLFGRMYGTPVLFGVGLGAFLLGGTHPAEAPMTALAAAIANVLQVKMTLIVLHNYEARMSNHPIRNSFFLLSRIVCLTVGAALLTLATSAAVEGQRSWVDVWNAAAFWTIGDLGSGFVLWIGLKNIGFKLSSFSENRRLSAQQETEFFIQSVSQLCRFLLTPVFGSRSKSFGAWLWIGEWIKDQRALGRPDRAVRVEAAEHLLTEVASRLASWAAVVSPNFRDRLRQSLSEMCQIAVRFVYWLLIGHWRA